MHSGLRALDKVEKLVSVEDAPLHYAALHIIIIIITTAGEKITINHSCLLLV